MKCQRCGGLVITEWDMALGMESRRCVICADRPMNPPSRDPIQHGLCEPKLGDLTHCKCGNLKVEWRSCCATCSLKKLHYYQRKAHAKKYGLIAAITKEMRP